MTILHADRLDRLSVELRVHRRRLHASMPHLSSYVTSASGELGRIPETSASISRTSIDIST